MAETWLPMEKQTKRAYRGHMIHALSQEQWVDLPDGGLLVDEAGQVVACDAWERLASSYSLEEWPLTCLPSHQLLMPGLIDTHVHLPQLSVAGQQEANLLAWLERHIFEAEARFEARAHAQAMSEWFFQSLLKNGTTTAAVFLTSHPEAATLAFEAAERLGNRVVMGQNLMDIHAPAALLRPAAQALQETETLARAWHGREQGRLQYAWMPRFALTSSEPLLAGVGELRRRYPTVYLHTHLSEQRTEIEATLHQFPWAQDYTGVYERFGLLGPRTILAHGIHLSAGEMRRLHGLQASLAHCPSSNFFLKSGCFPLWEVLAQGLRVGLGSDVGAGPELSLFRVMRDAQYMQAGRWVPLATLFYLATLGGAEALCQADRLGNFLPGKEADFIVVDLATPYRALQTAESNALVRSDREGLLSSLVYLADDRWVQATYVRGRCVYPGRHWHETPESRPEPK